jgi:hypothetical protein
MSGAVIFTLPSFTENSFESIFTNTFSRRVVTSSIRGTAVTRASGVRAVVPKETYVTFAFSIFKAFTIVRTIIVAFTFFTGFSFELFHAETGSIVTESSVVAVIRAFFTVTCRSEESR